MEIAENELPCLTDLIFDNTPWVNLNNLALLLWNTKAPIQTLHLNYCHNVTGEDLINNFIEDPMDINPALRKMTNLGVAGIAGIDDTTVTQICTALPDLKILDLSETRITGCTIRMVAEAKNDDSAMAKLDGLVIKRCDGVDPDAIEYGRSMGLLILN
jgi:F-box/TPR repeat protein Pof3